MAKGRKTGGRKRGTPNRATQAVAEILKQERCEPIRGMARIAKNPRNPIELRGRMFAELAAYLYPKRKAVELSAPGGGPVQYEDVSSAKERILRRISEMAGPDPASPGDRKP